MEAASHNPDIILLDLGLPDIDGVEVIREDQGMVECSDHCDQCTK